jgi:hypothetical protein
LIVVTSIPTVCNVLIADSRPAPGPLTNTSTLRKPSREQLFHSLVQLDQQRMECSFRTTETHFTSTRPRNNLTLIICQSYNDIVKRCVNVSLTYRFDNNDTLFLQLF